jgi:hypothetical protein
MGISFSSSLFGLAGSLILGFLDLQAGQAQTRFYNELEDWLSTTADDTAPTAGGDIAAALERLQRAVTTGGGAPSTQSLATLAEGIQQLVQHMRQEQQQIRDWVEAQADSHQDIKKLLQRLVAERESR